MGRANLRAVLLAISIAACGGKTMATGQSKPDASDSGQSASNVGTPADAAPEVADIDEDAEASDARRQRRMFAAL
jgi:hypothetical protein